MPFLLQLILIVIIFTLSSGATYNYSLYWSGYTVYSKFNGLSNNAFLSVWEAFPFTIQANRGPKTNATLTNPPGTPPSFEGRLREVSITFNSSNNASFDTEYLIFGGRQSVTLCDRKDSRMMLRSHCTLYSRKNYSFWAKEYSQRNGECMNTNKDGIQYYPGCLNSPDEADTSFISLSFPVGHASLPHGKYADGIISVSLTKFDYEWIPKVDFGSSHQNFVLLLLPRQLNFSIDSTSSSIGKMEPFEWGRIDADILKNPPDNARNIKRVSNSSDSTLFVDGEKPLKRNSRECSVSACPTNCPASERDALISRHRRALLCLKGPPATRTLSFTCSVPCPLWQAAAPHVVWLRDGHLLTMNDATIMRTPCGSKTLDKFNISTNYYTEKITLNVSTSGRTRVECRAFVSAIPELPCCTNTNEKSLCQPDTGIARVVVDILSENHLNASDWCKAGVDLNSPLVLPLDDECPFNGEPQYCGKKSEHERDSTIGSILGDFPKAAVIGGGLGFFAIVFSIALAIIGAIVYTQKTSKNKTSYNYAGVILVHEDLDGIVQEHHQSSNSGVILETSPTEDISETRALEPKQSNTGLEIDKPLSNEQYPLVQIVTPRSPTDSDNVASVHQSNDTVTYDAYSASYYDSGSGARAPISKQSAKQNVPSTI